MNIEEDLISSIDFSSSIVLVIVTQLDVLSSLDDEGRVIVLVDQMGSGIMLDQPNLFCADFYYVTDVLNIIGKGNATLFEIGFQILVVKRLLV